MPIKVPNDLPAATVLENENMFVMRENRAASQDIRPLDLLILNLMPTKVETEIQIMRLLSNSPLQVNVRLLQMSSHVSKNTSQEYLDRFYDRFDDVKSRKWDGMIITGAPVENIDFEEVDYWDELCQIMEWSKKNVFSTYAGGRRRDSTTTTASPNIPSSPRCRGSSPTRRSSGTTPS